MLTFVGYLCFLSFFVAFWVVPSELSSWSPSFSLAESVVQHTQYLIFLLAKILISRISIWFFFTIIISFSWCCIFSLWFLPLFLLKILIVFILWSLYIFLLIQVHGISVPPGFFLFCGFSLKANAMHSLSLNVYFVSVEIHYSGILCPFLLALIFIRICWLA